MGCVGIELLQVCKTLYPLKIKMLICTKHSDTKAVGL